MPRQPADKLTVTALMPLDESPRTGRPPKPKMPRMPNLHMDDYERSWFDYHFGAYIEEYPDLTETDRITLLMASAEFVKYLRMLQGEMATKELVSMARQHPLTQYRALMEQLSVTRKARQAAGKDRDPDLEEQRKWLLDLSKRGA